jgi:hypothetical protein
LIAAILLAQEAVSHSVCHGVYRYGVSRRDSRSALARVAPWWCRRARLCRSALPGRCGASASGPLDLRLLARR